MASTFRMAPPAPMRSRSNPSPHGRAGSRDDLTRTSISSLSFRLTFSKLTNSAVAGSTEAPTKSPGAQDLSAAVVQDRAEGRLDADREEALVIHVKVAQVRDGLRGPGSGIALGEHDRAVLDSAQRPRPGPGRPCAR